MIKKNRRMKKYLYTHRAADMHITRKINCLEISEKEDMIPVSVQFFAGLQPSKFHSLLEKIVMGRCHYYRRANAQISCKNSNNLLYYLLNTFNINYYGGDHA